MMKWILVLAAALLFNLVQANAEGIFYTNNADRYYHANADCDRPAESEWWDTAPRELYARKVYQKYEISEEAAAEFQKSPCPVCVKDFDPVYLGNHLTEWTFSADIEPWEIVSEIGDGSFMSHLSIEDESFRREVADTLGRFSSYYEDYAEYKTGIVKRKHDYPSCFAGMHQNVQGSYTYMIVDPTDEILAAFEKMFGSGAWIIPAKYGYDEMNKTVSDLSDALDQWNTLHPESDAYFSYGYIDVARNCVPIGIVGEDWQQAAEAMEEIAPIYVCFVKGVQSFTAGS